MRRVRPRAADISALDAVVTKEESVLVVQMSDLFRIRLAVPADAEAIAWHRARMFHDMGEVPSNLFETFRAKSRDRLHDALARGEYIGWLASPENDPNIIVGGAGVHLQRTLPHPLSRSALAEGRHGVIVNVFTEPEWRRRGVAEMLLRRIIEWAGAERLDRLVLHASNEGRALYERLGFVTSNEMRLAGD
jgi:GNAT superfamily N-acetyltransferase